MSKWLELSLQAVQQSYQNLLSFLQNMGWNPLAWNAATWLGLVLIVLTIAILISVSRKRPKKSRRPELLVSKGIIKQPELSPTQVLSLKVSNLNAFPVQLLEIAVQSELMSTPFMVEAAEIIAPQAAIELEAVLPNNIVGDGGTIEIYVYSSKRQNKIFRLATKFEWEPWASRYKVAPTGQFMRLVKSLASTRVNQARKKDWYQQNLKTQPHSINHDVEPPEQNIPDLPPKPLSAQLDMDFPTEF